MGTLLRAWVFAAVGFIATAQNWTALGPWATAVGPTEVVISWKAAEPHTAAIQYAVVDSLQSENWRTLAVEAPATFHQVRIPSLNPGTRYTYSILLSLGEQSPPAFVTTPPEEPQPVVFLVYGDTQKNHDRHRLVAERMSGEEAAFAVHLGDLVESPVSGDWRGFFEAGASLFRAMGFYSVWGNHERNDASAYDLFARPPGGGKEGEQWWQLRWGEVLLVGLDSNLPFLKFTGLRDQTEWVAKALAQQARFKFVFFHHPLFSSDTYYYPGDEGLAKLWHPIFLKHGVTAVFSGHSHTYEHLVRDGLHYFVSGGGGGPLYTLSPRRVEGSVFGVESVLHYLRVEVSAQGVRVSMIPVAWEERDAGGRLIMHEGKPLEVVELGR